MYHSIRNWSRTIETGIEYKLYLNKTDLEIRISFHWKFECQAIPYTSISGYYLNFYLMTHSDT